MHTFTHCFTANNYNFAYFSDCDTNFAPVYTLATHRVSLVEIFRVTQFRVACICTVSSEDVRYLL